MRLFLLCLAHRHKNQNRWMHVHVPSMTAVHIHTHTHTMQHRGGAQLDAIISPHMGPRSSPTAPILSRCNLGTIHRTQGAPACLVSPTVADGGITTKNGPTARAKQYVSQCSSTPPPLRSSIRPGLSPIYLTRGPCPRGGHLIRGNRLGALSRKDMPSLLRHSDWSSPRAAAPCRTCRTIQPTLFRLRFELKMRVGSASGAPLLNLALLAS